MKKTGRVSVAVMTIGPSRQQAASAYCDKVYSADLEQGIPEAIDIDGKFYDVLMSNSRECLAKELDRTRRYLK